MTVLAIFLITETKYKPNSYILKNKRLNFVHGFRRSSPLSAGFMIEGRMMEGYGTAKLLRLWWPRNIAAE